MTRADGRRAWWIDFLGARRDSLAHSVWWEPTPEMEMGVHPWGRARRLVATSAQTVLDCLYVEPNAVEPNAVEPNAVEPNAVEPNAVEPSNCQPDDQPPVIVLPFYDVESLLGLPTPRTARLSEQERAARAYGRQLVERGLAVLLVPWWCEVEASAAGESSLDLDGRYTAPAARHREGGDGTGLGRAVGDVMAAVDALVAAYPGRTLGAFGHSLGGKIVLALAALDDRISAAVIHEPGLGWAHSNWEAAWYLDAAPPQEPDLDELLSLIGPRPCLYVGGGGFDGPDNEPLARAVLQGADGQNLEIRYHNSGHTPPTQVLQDCYGWLHSHLADGR